MDKAKVDLLNTLAHEYNLKVPEKALIYIQQAEEGAAKLNYTKGKAVNLWARGRYVSEKQPQAALALYRQALALAEQVDDQEGICNYHRAIGSTLTLLGDLKTGTNHLNRALDLARELANNKLIIQSLRTIADYHYRHDHLIEATHYLQEVISLAEELGIQEPLGHVYSTLSFVQQKQNNYTSALEYRLSALRVFERQKDSLNQFHCLLNLGGLYNEQNNFTSALEMLNRAKQIATEFKNDVWLSMCYQNLGSLYRRSGKPEAISYFQQAISIGPNKPIALEINTLISIAQIYSSQKNFQQAKQTLIQAQTLVSNHPEHTTAEITTLDCQLYLEFGSLSLKEQKYKQAEDYLQQGLDLARKNNVIKQQQQAQNQFVMLYEQTGRYKEALASYKEYRVLRDSLINQKTTRQIALLESNYKFAKEREIYEIEKTNHQLRIHKQQQAILYLVIISLLMLLLIFVIYRSSKLRKQVMQFQIDQINQELEANQKIMAVAKLKLVQNAERDAHNVKILEEIEKGTDPAGESKLNSLINQYKLQTHHSNWEEFEALFTKVNSSFLEKLTELFPTLTPNERKLCVFLKLNMNNKDIAQITFQTEEALKKSRLRLRQKLNIDRSINLTSFIQGI